MLAETERSLQDIAEAYSYTSYSYLTTVFKQTTGSTPHQYRKQVKI
ncbi:MULTISPECIES: AraC family transcriptional regulator [unclassified Lentimonas]|nr:MULTISPECIES: AraC family transcriptional regulator [unclassified Lentimonas]